MSRSSRGPRRRSRSPRPAAAAAKRRAPAWLGRAELAVALLASAFILFLHARLWSQAGPLWRDLALYGLVTLSIALPLYFTLLLRVGFRTQPWYYVALMAVTVCCAEAMLEAPSTAFRLARLCGVGALVGLVAPGVHEYLGLRQTNMDWVVASLPAPTREDLVVVTPWSTLPPLEDKSLHRPDLVKRTLAAEDPVGPLFERVRATLESGHRVFVVGSLGNRVTERPPRLPPAPGVPTGWWQGTYGANWSAQLQFDLQTHARSAEALNAAGSQAVIPYEIAAAWAVEGWR